MQLFIPDRVRLSPSFGIRINFLLPMLQITVPQVIMCWRLGQQLGTLLGGCGTFVSWRKQLMRRNALQSVTRTLAPSFPSHSLPSCHEVSSLLYHIQHKGLLQNRPANRGLKPSNV